MSCCDSSKKVSEAVRVSHAESLTCMTKLMCCFFLQAPWLEVSKNDGVRSGTKGCCAKRCTEAFRASTSCLVQLDELKSFLQKMSQEEVNSKIFQILSCLGKELGTGLLFSISLHTAKQPAMTLAGQRWPHGVCSLWAETVHVGLL